MSDLNNDEVWNNACQQNLGMQSQMQNQNMLIQSLYGYASGGNSGGQNSTAQQYAPPPTTKKDQSMFKAIASDVKSFILEHRSIIYFLAFALLVDHFVFRGAFKARLQGCVDRLVTKVEEKIQ